VKKSSLTGIIDYGVGNIRSVFSAVEAVGGKPMLTSDCKELDKCDRLILPGVGAFGHGMSELKARGLGNHVKKVAAEGKPLLGICLGMQMLSNSSLEFGATAGLGLVDGVVSPIDTHDSTRPLRLPHVAWKKLTRINASAGWLFEGVDPSAMFYFIHSYAIPVTSVDAVATADHDGIDFAAVVAVNNVIGTQFHPEKSGPAGLKMLKNFISRGCE
jgi:glutamine amidotransferase